MPRLLPRLLALLLCGTALAGCATPALKDTLGVAAPLPVQDAAVTDSTDLDGSVRQAQLLRLAGHYDEAVHILSQLMLVASDDPRVVGEYGKSLAAQGRSNEAAQFLRRAVELSPSDWSFYSALGVSYDQLGNQTDARTAYEHALALRPGEASVLNNYALSRMLAGDPGGAQVLMTRAEAAGGGTDAKIARNIALVASLTQPKAAPVMAASALKPAPMAQNAAPLHIQHEASVAAQALITDNPLPAPSAAPRPLQPAPQFLPAPPRQASAAPSGVVMQAVPFDPLAGPVAPPRGPRVAAKANAKVAAKMSGKALAAAALKAQTAADAMDVKSAKPVPVKTAQKNDAVPSLRMAADKY